MDYYDRYEGVAFEFATRTRLYTLRKRHIGVELQPTAVHFRTSDGFTF